MRTKTLFAAAAMLAAGITASVAQSNVYSLNVVGYVNKTYDAGYHMIANPLNTTNNTIASLFASPPLFSVVYKFSGGAFQPANSYFSPWTQPNMTLNPGEGAFLFIPAGPTYSNTYVGEVLQGSRTNPLAPGYNIKGTIVPQQGGLQTVHLVNPTLFDVTYQWNDPAKTYFPSKSYFAPWAPSEPIIDVAEGFWYFNSAAGTNNWVRNFTVQ